MFDDPYHAFTIVWVGLSLLVFLAYVAFKEWRRPKPPKIPTGEWLRSHPDFTADRYCSYCGRETRVTGEYIAGYDTETGTPYTRWSIECPTSGWHPVARPRKRKG